MTKFTEKILNGKYFLCGEYVESSKWKHFINMLNLHHINMLNILASSFSMLITCVIRLVYYTQISMIVD